MEATSEATTPNFDLSEKEMFLIFMDIAKDLVGGCQISPPDMSREDYKISFIIAAKESDVRATEDKKIRHILIKYPVSCNINSILTVRGLKMTIQISGWNNLHRETVEMNVSPQKMILKRGDEKVDADPAIVDSSQSKGNWYKLTVAGEAAKAAAKNSVDRPTYAAKAATVVDSENGASSETPFPPIATNGKNTRKGKNAKQPAVDKAKTPKKSARSEPIIEPTAEQLERIDEEFPFHTPPEITAKNTISRELRAGKIIYGNSGMSCPYIIAHCFNKSVHRPKEHGGPNTTETCRDINCIRNHLRPHEYDPNRPGEKARRASQENSEEYIE